MVHYGLDDVEDLLIDFSRRNWRNRALVHFFDDYRQRAKRQQGHHHSYKVHLERSFGSAAVAQLAQSCISSQDSALLLIPALISSSDISTIAQDTAPVLIDLGMPRWTPGPGVLPLDAAAGPTLAGTATCAGGSSLDGTNRLRPPLARSDQQCIGAMMMDKHRQLFGRDAALERPFQPMLVSNQMQADALDIVLPGLQDCNEAHHRSVHSLDAVNAAVALPACDTFNRRLPDKAIDLLGKAGLRARCAAREHSLASASPDPYAGDCVPASSLAEGQQALQARVGALKEGLIAEAALLRESEANVKARLWCLPEGRRRSSVAHAAASVAAWRGLPIERMSQNDWERFVRWELAHKAGFLVDALGSGDCLNLTESQFMAEVEEALHVLQKLVLNKESSSLTDAYSIAGLSAEDFMASYPDVCAAWMEEARELEIYRERVVEPAGRQGLLELRCLELVKTIKDVSELPNWRNILVQEFTLQSGTLSSLGKDFEGYEPPTGWSNRDLHVPVELTCEDDETDMGTRLPSSKGGCWNGILFGRSPKVCPELPNGFRTAPLCVAVAGMAMWYPSDHYKMAAWIGVPRAKLRNGRCLTLGTCNVSTEYSGRPGEIAERVVFVAGRDSHIWKSRIMFG